MNIGILKEEKIPADKRVAFSPEQCKKIISLYPNIKIYVQSSDIRCFSDDEYISLGKVKFEHVSFPLNLAALNAEKILKCGDNDPTNFNLLTEIYKRQNKWSVGSDINIINNSIKHVLPFQSR